MLNARSGQSFTEITHKLRLLNYNRQLLSFCSVGADSTKTQKAKRKCYQNQALTRFSIFSTYNKINSLRALQQFAASHGKCTKKLQSELNSWFQQVRVTDLALMRMLQFHDKMDWRHNKLLYACKVSDSS